MQTAASGIKWSATFARENRGKSKEPERAARRPVLAMRVRGLEPPRGFAGEWCRRDRCVVKWLRSIETSARGKSWLAYITVFREFAHGLRTPTACFGLCG